MLVHWTKPVENFEISPVLTDGWFDRSTCQELQAAGWHTDHEEELIAVCKHISFFFCEKINCGLQTNIFFFCEKFNCDLKTIFLDPRPQA